MYVGEHSKRMIRYYIQIGLLERIRELFAGDESPVPPRQQKLGTVEVRSHILVKPGIEIQFVPEEAGFSH
jgi:hypothetical protein